jgi:ABC-2 type transport system permease protein
VDWAHVGLSTVISVVVLLVGWTVFARLERTVLKEI